ncbi:hypothetical protein EXIGLDRAFT_769715 [Exidia glandulosa HHB12029]|uniref:Uncharacterized protein n=1 Tax=Exidia glandulosa HHB12029 TaxID=1314781 RepID=A0A165HAE2_EXIGL|nr:hypothetical protein EXIGLDRAFT_769715 [Exidia glandulosa HHB12029]
MASEKANFFVLGALVPFASPMSSGFRANTANRRRPDKRLKDIQDTAWALSILRIADIRCALVSVVTREMQARASSGMRPDKRLRDIQDTP